MDMLGDTLIDAAGTSTPTSALASCEAVGIYFSAHWCPPCKGFTPQLGATYEKVVAAGKKMSVIFVSSDKSPSEFKDYFGSMPKTWGAIPSGDKRKDALSKLFEVEGIPTLVILDAKTGAVINANGRGAIASDPEGANFPWTPPAVAELSSTADGINETTSVCLMLEGCSAEVKAELGAAFLEIAQSSKDAGEDMIFFYAKESDGPVPQVRKLTKLGDAGSEPALALLDIPDNGGYYTCDTKVTAETIREFLADYKVGGKLTRKQLG